jgi:hypothetical protein
VVPGSYRNVTLVPAKVTRVPMNVTLVPNVGVLTVSLIRTLNRG